MAKLRIITSTLRLSGQSFVRSRLNEATEQEDVEVTEGIEDATRLGLTVDSLDVERRRSGDETIDLEGAGLTVDTDDTPGRELTVDETRLLPSGCRLTADTTGREEP